MTSVLRVHFFPPVLVVDSQFHNLPHGAALVVCDAQWCGLGIVVVGVVDVVAIIISKSCEWNGTGGGMSRVIPNWTIILSAHS